MEQDRKYQIEKIKSMSDLDALILLYDEMLDACEAAQASWKEKNSDLFQQKTKWMIKIIEGLMTLIDMDVDRQLGANLLRIYEYLIKQLEVAQSEIRQTEKIMNECAVLINKLRDAWIEVREKGDVTASFKSHLTSEDARFLNIEI